MKTALLVLVALYVAPAPAQQPETPKFLLLVDARPPAKKGNGARDISEAPTAFAGFSWNRVGPAAATECASLRAVVEKDSAVSHLGRALACSQVPTGQVSEGDFRAQSLIARDAAAAVAMILRKNREDGTLRTTALKGEVMRIAVLHEGLAVVRSHRSLNRGVDAPDCPVALLARPVDVPIKAEKRRTQLSTDAKALVQIAFALGGPVTPAKPKALPTGDPKPACNQVTELDSIPVTLVRVYNHAMTLDRATVDVGVDASAAPSQMVIATVPEDSLPKVLHPEAVRAASETPARPESGPSDGSNGAVKKTPLPKAQAGEKPAEKESDAMHAKITTGPAEHWFLSADVPLQDTKAKTFDYNQDSNQIEISEKPSTFQLGVNMMLGDLLAPDRNFFENLYVKGSVAASNKPLDSFAVGVGYRGGIPIIPKSWGLSFDTLSPFVVRQWTKEDAATGTTVVHNASRKAEWRFGVGVNISKAIGWTSDE